MSRATQMCTEEANLESLRRYPVLDLEPEEAFDDITRLAAELSCAPIALLTLVEAGRLWYKSKIGLTSLENIREDSFCSWAISEKDLLIISDASKDSRFNRSPMVWGTAGFRFYASVPLMAADGETLGMLSVIDRKPRGLSPSQAKSLRTLAAALVAQLELKDKNELLKQAVTEREHAYELLSKHEERYSLIARSNNEGIWEWNLETNEANFCNRWKALLGYDNHEIGIRIDEWFKRVHPEDIDPLQQEVMSHLLGLTQHFQQEHRVLRRDGTYRWMLSRGAALWDANRQIYRMAGSFIDITDQKESEQKLLHNAFHDPLTGLPNRELFMEQLKRALDRARNREDYLFAVLFLDLDRFKAVNDRYGHQVGDEFLIAVARRLEASLRPEDLITRLGGDEFAVLLDHLRQVSDVTQAAERIQKELAVPFHCNGHEINTSVSIGIALNLIPYDSPEDLLRSADTAMYRAKDQGRGCYELFDNGMYVPGVALAQLESDLRRALSRNELRVYYQPIISVANWQITGFEALIRWQHPEKGLMSPLEFIPMAEETDLIIPVGQFVLREACRQLYIWQEQFPTDPPLTMSVNLSGRQFSQPDLIDMINESLVETGIRSSSLKIEITESAIIESIESATAILHQIKALGIRICLDDFGTGYSSLSYLHRFPIDTLKIDRSFITRMKLPKNTEIVRTIISLANSIGMDVIAEGVETREQIIMLSELDCEHIQGYLLSKPLDGEAMGELLKETYQQQLEWPAGAAQVGLDVRPYQLTH